MEDMKYLDTLADIDRELWEIVNSYNARLLGVVGRDNLVGLRMEQNEVLMQAIKKHRRTLMYLLGMPVEPVAHSVEAILVGVMGGDAE